MKRSTKDLRKAWFRSSWIIAAIGLVGGAAAAQVTIPRDTRTHVAPGPGAHVTAHNRIRSSEFVRIEQSGEEVPLEVPAGMALVVTDVHCEVYTGVVGPGAFRVHLVARLASGTRRALFNMRLPLDEDREAYAAVAMTSGFILPAQAALELVNDPADASLSNCNVYGYFVATGPVRIDLPDLERPRPLPPGVPPPTTEPPF